MRLSGAVDEESQERQLNIHLDPENLAGVYANFANVGFSDYEFRSRSPASTTRSRRRMCPESSWRASTCLRASCAKLIDAMNDSWSKWSTREGIRNLPEQGSPRF